MDDVVTQLLPMSAIAVPDRLRDIDEDWVKTLSLSIEASRLHNAVTVRPAGEEGSFILVAGAHRHRAFEILGRTEIPCTIETLTDDQARIVEIDENLMRRELNKLDRMIFLAERKEVHERLHPQTKHGGDRKSATSQIKSQSLRLDLDPVRFTAEVADKIGLSERAVELAIQTARALSKDTIAALRGTKWADNQDTLVRLSKHDHAQQRTIARELAEGRAKTIDGAMITAGLKPGVPTEAEQDPQDRYLATLLETWLKATPRTRDAFLHEIKLAEDAAQKKGRKP